MKKVFYILSAVVAAFTISACDNTFEDEAPVVGGEKSNKITFTATQATDDVRSSLDLFDGQTALWNGSEKIGLYYYYTPSGGSEVKYVTNYPYSATSSGDATTSFTGEAEWWDGEGAAAATHKIYIYHPYKADNDDYKSSAVKGVLPTEQAYDATATQWDMTEYDFLYSSDNPAAYGEKLDFGNLKRLFSVLRLGITNNTGEDVEIKSVSITSEGGKILAGEFLVNLSKGRAENALTNRTDAPVKATHGSSTAYGYWTSTASTITTEVSNGAVAAGDKIDVRFVLNAGYNKSDSSSDYFFDTTSAYLDGDTFAVNIVTNKGTHPEVKFTAGALLRGQRAGKSITLDAVPAGEPSATDIKSSDSSESKYYLNNTIKISGVNLLNAQNIKVGGVAAEVESQTGTELVVKVPDCTGAATAAATYAITYTYESVEKEFGQITVYPFYHYENITLGMGSSSGSTYSDFSSENAYFVPDDGKVYSAADFAATSKDYGIGLGSGVKNPYLTASNTYAATLTSELYLDVKPYVTFVTNSSGKLTVVNPANSDVALKNHRYKTGGASSYNTYVGETWGTPFIQYRVMKSDSELKYAAKVKDGSLTEMCYSGSASSANAPAFAAAGKVGNSLWNEESVIIMHYKDYLDKATVLKEGCIYIKKIEVTLGDVSGDNQYITENAETGKRDGKITFDMYWSKKSN